MEYTLIHLIDSLQSCLKVLKSEAHVQLNEKLHDPNQLPDQKLMQLSRQVLDLLQETRLLLEPGSLVLADHFLGFANSKCLNAAVELGVPDALHTKSMTIERLSDACNAQVNQLGHVMHALCNNGIFECDKQSKLYSNNRVSELLLKDHWTQWHSWVDLYGNEFYDMARGIPAACKKGSNRSPAQINYDTDHNMFAYFSQQGWLPKLHNTLGAAAIAQAPGILADYPWEEIQDCSLFDIGGGAGALVALLLREHKQMTAGILDLPDVIEHARKGFRSDGVFADVGDRVPDSHLVVGDFFDSVPRSEIYTMKWCLHDWDDIKAAKILRNIRSSLIEGPRSRLIVFESVVGDGWSNRLSRYADLNMWIAANGQERSEDEWRLLAKTTGWVLKTIYPLRNAWPCALEFVPNPGHTKRKLADHSTARRGGIAHESLGISPEISHDIASSVTADMDKKSQYTRIQVTDGAIEIEAPCARGETMSSLTQIYDLSSDRTKNAYQAVSSDRQFSNSYKPLTNLPKVRTTMTFLEPWDSIKGLPFFRSAPAEGYPSTNFKWEDSTIVIADARPMKEEFTLDKNGFKYLTTTPMPEELVTAIRIGSADTVKTLYYPEVESLIKAETKADRVIIFDHTMRKRDPNMSKGSNPDGREQPATVVHCDQSPKGAIRRLRQNLQAGEDADEILQIGRVQTINVWRPLVGPVKDWPLAQMDFTSLAEHDTYPCDLWRGEFEERGQTMTFTHAESQRWYYLSQHQVDEVTLLKIWDSDSADGRRANVCPHAAFQHPDTPLDAPPRESIEVRCLVIHHQKRSEVA